MGSKLGAWALSKNVIKQEYIAKTESFYEKYGGKTVRPARRGWWLSLRVQEAVRG